MNRRALSTALVQLSAALFALAIGAGCSDDPVAGGLGPIEAGDVTQADLYGSWYQYDVLEGTAGSPNEEVYVDFFEPDPASLFPGWARWEIWWAADGAYPAPSLGSSGIGFYQIDGVDIVIKREVCEPNMAANGDLTCTWRDFPTRITGYDGDTIAIAAESVFGSQPVTLTRYDSAGECPIQTPESGWITATEAVALASFDSGLTGNLREIDIAVDSLGRPYVLYAASAADGGVAVASPRGCRWRVAYVSGEAFAAELEIDADDNLHVAISTQIAALHTTSPAEGFEVNGSWTAQTWGWPAVGSTGKVGLAVDAAGQPWVVTNPGDGTSAMVHRQVDGEWQTDDLGVTGPYNIGVPVMADANADVDGDVHVFVGGFLVDGTATYAVDHHVYSDPTTSTVERIAGPEEVPMLDSVGKCWLRDIQGDVDGVVHSLCEFDIQVGFGENISASAHAWWDGSDWSVSWLSAVDAGELRVESDGTIGLMGEHAFEFDGTDWTFRTPPVMGSSLYSASATLGDGTIDVYTAGAGWAHQRERVEATTTVAVIQGGSAEGVVSSTDGSIDCDATCEVDVPEGELRWLVAEGTETSTFVGWDVQSPITAERIVSAVGERVEVTATFTFGRVQEPIELSERRNEPLAVFDGGDVLASYALAGGTIRDTRLSRLAADGGEVWGIDIDRMLLDRIEVSSDGGVIYGGPGNDDLQLPTVVGLDGANGSEGWSLTLGEVGGTITDVEPVPGGGAAVGVWFNNNVDLGVATIQAGLVFIDGDGDVTAAVSMVNVPGRSGNGGFDHLAAIDADTVVVADSPHGSPTDPGTVISFQTDGSENWRATPGGPIAHMMQDGAGGVWVLTTAPVDSGIACTQDDGLTGVLFRFDGAGNCLERWAGGATEGARVTTSGWVVTTGGGAIAIAQPGGLGSSLTLDTELSASLPRGVSVSPDGDWAAMGWLLPGTPPTVEPRYGVLPVRIR